MTVDLSPRACSERIRAAGEMSDLDPKKRLDSKIDMSAKGISARLKMVFELQSFCESLKKKSG